MLFRMLAVLAEFERDLVSERTTAALAHKRRNGERTGGIPYGWELADDVNIYETIGSELSANSLRDYGRWQSQFALGTKPGRAFIVDEAHTISRRCVEMLLKLLETGRIPRHVAWFFTTRRCGEARLFDDYDDADALLSRCEIMALTDQGIANAAAPRLREIVQLAGFPDGHDDRYYQRIVNDCGGSIRAAISEVITRARIAS